MRIMKGNMRKILIGLVIVIVLAVIFIIDLVRTFDLNLTLVLGVNQALEYAMFTAGILGGIALWSAYQDDDLFWCV